MGLTDDSRDLDRQTKSANTATVYLATIAWVAWQSWADNCAQIAFYDPFTLSHRSVEIIGRGGDGDGYNKTTILMPVDKSRILIDSGRVYSV